MLTSFYNDGDDIELYILLSSHFIRFLCLASLWVNKIFKHINMMGSIKNSHDQDGAYQNICHNII